MTKTLLVIVGPTGIGKTALSIKLAQYYKTEILSADSRQFYKEMSIGTAVPNKEELASVPHHFIHHKSVRDKYSVGDFEKDALLKLEYLFKEHDLLILVGGSGLYIDAVNKGFDDFPEIDQNIRKRLNKTLQNEGLEVLQVQLKSLDPIAYNMIAIDNPHRVIRALEVCIGSGKPYSSFLSAKKEPRPFKTITIGLTSERNLIYERINSRVDQMMKQGLLEEVKTLKDLEDLNALNTVGYKELFKFLKGEWTMDFAISEIKKNSRRFAKRQLTWFKKNPETLWFEYNEKFDKIISKINSKLQ